MVVHFCNPSYLGGRDREELWLGYSLSKVNARSYSKIHLKKNKRNGGHGSCVECLPSKLKALNLIPSVAKKGNKQVTLVGNWSLPHWGTL
jgi:hypothetical protein